VLIDYTNQLRSKQGYTVNDAIVEAGKTRLRPVLLTAITTVLGLLPMALQFSFDFRNFKFVFGGESSAWWAPLATAVIFGLMIATVLTLVLVPAMYMLTAGWQEGYKRGFKRWLGSPDELAEDQKKKDNGEPAKGPKQKEPAPELEPEPMPALD
jgi:hypothetical protein